jgi:hypothetical protein
METNWKPEKITDLVEKIYRVVQLQYRDIRRALHGQGNFQLAPHVQHLKISHINWTEKSEEEKDKIFQDFMKYKPRKRPANMVSTDGKLTITSTPRLAKKPCQRSRPKCAKTTTFK